ncbi:MAG TPA: hypothetical protein VGN34_21060 [Ktedonobacteraceae bacterium]|jgi:uncharacterized membrane protein HdeD (DUF308 family)
MRSLNVLYGAVVIGVLCLLAGIFLLVKGHHWGAYAGIGLGMLLLVGGITALITARGANRPRS